MQSTDGIDSARDQALEWAGSARATRHELRAQLSSGQRSLAEVLAEAHHDELTGQVKLLWALESLPGARKVDTRRTLAAMGLDEARRLGTLDTTTIEQLLGAFTATAAEGDDS